MDKIRIIITDDHALFREGLKLLLSRTDYIDEIFEACDGKELLDNYKKINADIIFLDIEMPNINGIEAAKQILDENPETKIIALSMYSDENYYKPMIVCGVKGFVLKNSDFTEVQDAIVAVLKGETYFSKEILNSLVKNLSSNQKKSKEEDLTNRESEILSLICKGHTNSEISEILNISKRTVDKHRENILLKTETKNTAELIIYALKKGLVQI